MSSKRARRFTQFPMPSQMVQGTRLKRAACLIPCSIPPEPSPVMADSGNRGTCTQSSSGVRKRGPEGCAQQGKPSVPIIYQPALVLRMYIFMYRNFRQSSPQPHEVDIITPFSSWGRVTCKCKIGTRCA